jgi:hypothetical protein
MRRLSRAFALLLALLAIPVLAAEESAAETEEIFAVLGDTVIPAAEFEANFHAGVRERFYHGSVPAADLAEFRREVARAMIDRLLLLREAERLGIGPDEAAVDADLERRAGILAASPDPAQARRVLRERLLADSVLDRFRARIEAVPAPERDAVQAYWRAHPDRFTTPERLRLSVILLKVEPWAPDTAWSGAHEEALRLEARLRGGAAFADLARLHSGDASAAQGGDLGYVHGGMLSREAQEVVDSMAPGEISAPVPLLQGVALFQLAERVAPELNAFEQVEERARELLHRELRAQAWEEALEKLRRDTPVTVNQALVDGI